MADDSWIAWPSHEGVVRYFVLVTSEGSRGKIIEAVNAGANDYVVKPIDEDSLMKKIGNLLG